MPRLSCPFCGPRDLREFHFVAEAGKTRPDTSAPVSDEDWARYLYRAANPRGPSREVWMHLTCRELFIIERDTATMEVLGTTALRDEAPT